VIHLIRREKNKNSEAEVILPGSYKKKCDNKCTYKTKRTYNSRNNKGIDN